jgi:hypothetical protein
MKPRATYIISLLLILLYAYTASSKVLEQKQFVMVLEDVPLIGRGAAMTAILLPLAELLVVLLLIFERTRLIGLYASLALLVLFTVYLGYMILFVPHLPCSCGGVISNLGWREHVVFNVVLISLNGLGIKWKAGLKYETI